jgi:two-component system cell cycle sensor histidine kinase/response regulator CckA
MHEGHGGDKGSPRGVDREGAPADGPDADAAAVDRLLGDRAILENLPGRVLLVTRDYRIVYVNRATPGRAAADFTGTAVVAHIAEEHRPLFRDVFDKAWISGAPGVVELRTMNGTWWEARLAPVKSAAAPGFMLVTSVDITSRKEAERALLESETRLRHAIEATGVGTWSWDRRTDAITWDARLCAIFGVAVDDAPKGYDGYMALIHPDDRGRLGATIARNLEKGIYEELEHRIVRPGGEVRHVLAKGVPIIDAGGATVGFRGGVFDVTERKWLEEQLGQAQKMEAVGQLTAGIAHNFNNLLAIILPNTQLCRAEPGREGDQRLTDIEQAGRRASEMVRQLMLFAGHAGETTTAPLDLVAIANRTADVCRATFDRRIAVQVEAAGDVPPVEGRESQIEQVLLNLCTNARDAIVEASVAAPRIVIAVDASQRGAVRIRVSDNGAGMTEATRLRVFEPFFTTRGIGHGTGLGLASAYAIVKQHGGKIRCESRPGAGATFDVELPATAGSTLRFAPSVLPEGAAAVTVLVIDDEPLLRRVVRAILEQDGYRVIEAADGLEGIYVFERHHATVGAVILDRSMPGMSGEDVHARLSEIDAAVPVILLSGLPSDTWKGRRPSVVLSKPADAASLVDAVRRLAPSPSAPARRP